MSVSDEKMNIAAPTVTEMRILRRPKGEDQPAEATRARKDQGKGHQKSKTLEEKQAAYEEARSRILGSDYKPEATPTPEDPSSPVASRNRSPEQIRVRRPSPPVPLFVPVYQPPVQRYQMPPSDFYLITPQPYFYIDTSRPPPSVLPMAGIQYAPPPRDLFTPRTGTLGEALQIIDPRSQAQRKNRHKKKKIKEMADAAN